MAKFESAIPIILQHEGGAKFTQTPGDRGGATKYGITLATLRRWRGKRVQARDVKALTQEEAEKIYRLFYWEACRCDEIVNQDVATKVFDVAVNCGPERSARIVQKACSFLLASATKCPIDGVIGPKTITTINVLGRTELLKGIIRFQREHYERIISRDPTQEKFRRGWMNRAAWPKETP